MTFLRFNGLTLEVEDADGDGGCLRLAAALRCYGNGVEAGCGTSARPDRHGRGAGTRGRNRVMGEGEGAARSPSRSG